MLEQISESFIHNDSFEALMQSPWVLGVFCIASVIILLLIILSLKARRKKYILYGYISDPRQIRTVFHMVLDQRRLMEIQAVTQDDKRRPVLRCSPVAIKDNSITIELNGLHTLSHTWVGKELRVFFRIKIDGNFSYFTFISVIQSVDNLPHNICQANLAVPATLENRQKRSFLRISPPMDLVLGSALWYGATLPKPETLNDINLWPSPAIFLLPHEREEFTIIDISAGGLRLQVPHKTIQHRAISFHSIEQLIIVFDLFDPEHGKRVRTWAQCRIQNVWEEHTSRDIFLGLQFLSWAKPKEHFTAQEPIGSIDWFRLSMSNEIEIIGNWIMRRHLDIVRDTPHVD